PDRVPVTHGEIYELLKVARQSEWRATACPNLIEIDTWRDCYGAAEQRREETVQFLEIHGVLAREAAQDRLQTVVFLVSERPVQCRPAQIVVARLHGVRIPGRLVLPQPSVGMEVSTPARIPV